MFNYGDHSQKLHVSTSLEQYTRGAVESTLEVDNLSTFDFNAVTLKSANSPSPSR